MSENIKGKEPRGQLAIRTVAMPADTNPSGNIFGGWVVSQMDLAGATVCRKLTSNTVVTVAIEAMEFIQPIHVGDFVCCYAEVVKTGTTSMTVNIETWAVPAGSDQRHQVTEGVFIYVSVDKSFKPTPLDV
jgi:acyl-CoA thioesterase YciA